MIDNSAVLNEASRRTPSQKSLVHSHRTARYADHQRVVSTLSHEDEVDDEDDDDELFEERWRFARFSALFRSRFRFRFSLRSFFRACRALT